MHFIKHRLLPRARSVQGFYNSIMSTGLSLDFDRDGIPSGVIDTNGKRYSWKKLGITQSDFDRLAYREDLTRLENKVSQLEKLNQLRGKNKEKENDRDR